MLQDVPTGSGEPRYRHHQSQPCGNCIHSMLCQCQWWQLSDLLLPLPLMELPLSLLALPLLTPSTLPLVPVLLLPLSLLVWLQASEHFISASECSQMFSVTSTTTSIGYQIVGSKTKARVNGQRLAFLCCTSWHPSLPHQSSLWIKTQSQPLCQFCQQSCQCLTLLLNRGEKGHPWQNMLTCTSSCPMMCPGPLWGHPNLHHQTTANGLQGASQVYWPDLGSLLVR